MKMKILEYTLQFHSPAFLGNAEQVGQWRTPPIKALLRQWWRVAYAADRSFNVEPAAMRYEEGRLFGHAWLNDDHDTQGRPVTARKSQVRIRLDRWDEGKLRQWPNPEATVHHPEVGNHGANVGSALYLGYGPLRFHPGGTALKANAAIQAGESASLSLALPEADTPRIKRALWLMDRYGTLGGRSRNGWGSFVLSPLPAGEGWGEGELPLRAWQECLTLDWPHAIGQDAKGALIWQTPPFDEWKAVMKRLAEIKIGLRRQFLFPDAPPGSIHNRHWLSYPVTHHKVNAWGNNARLPNTLRFKVRPAKDGKLAGAIFHVPHLPPPQFHPNQAVIQNVWSRVHAFLDAPAQSLIRLPE